MASETHWFEKGEVARVEWPTGGRTRMVVFRVTPKTLANRCMSMQFVDQFGAGTASVSIHIDRVDQLTAAMAKAKEAAEKALATLQPGGMVSLPMECQTCHNNGLVWDGKAVYCPSCGADHTKAGGADP